MRSYSNVQVNLFTCLLSKWNHLHFVSVKKGMKNKHVKGGVETVIKCVCRLAKLTFSSSAKVLHFTTPRIWDKTQHLKCCKNVSENKVWYQKENEKIPNVRYVILLDSTFY